MPYYAPPGGSMTAAFARSLMLTNALEGLGRSPNSTMYARPSASAIAVRAAQSTLLPRRSQRAGVSYVMNGMGLGILPSVNVRYVKTAIPAAFAYKRHRRLSGLGKGSAGGNGVHPRAFAVTPIMGIRHQPGIFMGPGGPGSAPGWFPGYFMSGSGLHLGQDDGTYSYSPDGTIAVDNTTGNIVDLTTGTVYDSNGIPLGASPSIPPTMLQTTTMQPSGGLVAPAPYSSSGTPLVNVNPKTGQITSALQPATSQLTNLLTSIFGPSPAHPTQVGGAPAPSINLSGVVPIVAAGVIGLAALSMIGGKKRR
jgi:hypothetical protein